MFVIYFLLWTFLLYWIHRGVHYVPYFRTIHLDHHEFISHHTNATWHWSNLCMCNDTIHSTMDLWITEIIPTMIFGAITGQWWILLFYYIWAATIQERIEHKGSFNLPFLSSGKWHLLHHADVRTNFGLFLPIWDIIFGTNQNVSDYLGK